MTQRENWLLVRCGTQYHLLLREEDGYYLAKIGRYRNRKLERTLAGKEISRGMLKEQGLGIQDVSCGALRGVSIGGTEVGDPVYLYPQSGNRRTILLAEQIDADWLEGFFAGIGRFDPPVDKRKRRQDPEFWRKEKQNPDAKRKLKWVPWVLTAVGVGCAAAFLRSAGAFWLLCAYGSMLVCLILVIAMPGYFTFMEKQQKKQKPYGISLSGPVLLTWFLTTPSVYNYPEQGRLFLCAGVFTAVVGCLLLLAEEFRRDKWNLWVLLMVFVFGLGTVSNINETLDNREPETQYVQVQKLEHRRRTKGVDSYFCTVRMPDGREEKLEVYPSVYRALEEGDRAILATGEGALGIVYQHIQPVA